MKEKDKIEIIQLCLEKKAREAKYIDPKSIAISDWVRHKCQYGCPGYNKSYCCPPHSPSPETTRKIVSDYSIAVLIRFGGGVHISNTIVEIENQIFFKNYYKALGFGAGPCRQCKSCPEDGCNQQGNVRPAMEACGIDVYKTARDNGYTIDVLRSKEEQGNYYGMILIE